MKTRFFSQTALLAMLAGSTQALADSFPAVIELSTLDGTNGFVLNGIDAGDQSGFTVSSAGDMNGDGVDDIIIGARTASPNGSESGESYVVFGGAGIGSMGTLDLSSLDGTNGFVLNGIDADDQSGISVCSAGDLNGDGFDDIIIGAYRADPNGNTNAGESYVVFGGAGIGSMGTLDLSSLDGTNGFVLNGIDADDQSGISVSSAGDVNRDGFDDIIIGAHLASPNGTFSGESYVIFGSASIGSMGTLDFSSLNGTNGFVINGIDFDDQSGISVSSAGDVDGDGFDDLIIGAYRADPNGASSGESYVALGTFSIGFTGTLELSSLTGSNGFVLNGIDAGDQSGFTVSSAGDVNSDGFDDLLIGARRANPNGTSSGESYVVFGAAGVGSLGTIELSTLNGSNGFVLNGIDPGDRSGSSVSSAGDVNGDGIDDFMISAVFADPNGSFSGESYVVFGGEGIENSGTFELATLNGTNGFVLNGVGPTDQSGRSVSSAGDVNGDGVDDIIIGAYGAGPNGSFSGESYVVFGIVDPAILPLKSLNGARGFVINGQQMGDLAGVSVSNAGDFNGDGIDDLLVGANNASSNGYIGNGEVNLVFGEAEIGQNGTIELSEIQSFVTGLSFVGNGDGERFGSSVSCAGDFNADGFDDFIVGSGDATKTGIGSEITTLVYGTNSAAKLRTTTFKGIESSDRSGYSVSSAGDVNGDGVDDIIIGADLADPNGSSSGESYVVFGNVGIESTSSIELSELDGANGFVLNGIDTDDRSGASVSSAGDVNGDGVDDLIIGAPFANTNGNYFAGESYVVFGGVGVGSTGTIELSSLNGTNGFIMNGIDEQDVSGFSVSSAGDVNGDGVDDLVIGAIIADPNGITNAGESYVVFGGAVVGSTGTIELSSLNGTNGFILNGIDASDQSGRSVSSAGDVNGDGVDDLIIGAYRADPNGVSSGESYVVFGGVGVGASGTIELSSLNGTNGYVLNGVDAYDFSGSSVSSAGDVNGDGVDDLIIGAPFANPNGNSGAGESYVVFGAGPEAPSDPADFSGDGCVDSADLAILLAAWANVSADLNGDMVVDSADLAILLAAWGSGC